MNLYIYEYIYEFHIYEFIYIYEFIKWVGIWQSVIRKYIAK